MLSFEFKFRFYTLSNLIKYVLNPPFCDKVFCFVEMAYPSIFLWLNQSFLLGIENFSRDGVLEGCNYLLILLCPLLIAFSQGL